MMKPFPLARHSVQHWYKIRKAEQAGEHLVCFAMTINPIGVFTLFWALFVPEWSFTSVLGLFCGDLGYRNVALVIVKTKEK